jgi:predicted  nucleic acid-binding Zn-ribbon protein
MENISISHFENDAVQDKKLESYDWGKDNFLAGQELTVTITLREYRELVSSNATAKQQIDAKIQKVAALEQDLKKLKEEAERLKAENYDLQNKVLAAQSRDNAQGDATDGEGSCEE